MNESATEAALSLEELDERYTEEILRRCGGNKVHAAAMLEIDRKPLYRRAEAAHGGATMHRGAVLRTER